MLEISFLGTPAVRVDDKEIYDLIKSPNLLRLLAYLTLHRMQPQARSVLASLFYPNLDEAAARRNLNQLFYRLRGISSLCQFFTSTSQTIQFTPCADSLIDIAEFECCAGKSDLKSLERAVSLYSGEFLEGFYDSWCIAERERLHELFIAVLQNLTRFYKNDGNMEGVLKTARRWMQVDNFSEEVHATVVASLAEKGEIGEARKAWVRYESVWRNELNLKPSPQMWELAISYSLVDPSAEEAKDVDDFAALLKSAQPLTTVNVEDVPEAALIRQQLRNLIIDHADKLGDVFKNKFAHADALRHYEIALEWLDPLELSYSNCERAFGIRRKCDEVHDLSPNRVAQEQNLFKIQALAEQMDKPAARAESLLRHAWLDLRRNRFDSAIRFAQKANVLAHELPLEVQTLSLRILGLILFESSYYAEAYRSFAQAVSMDEQLQNNLGLQADYINLAAVANAQSKYSSALKAVEHAHLIAELGSTPPLQMRITGTKGQVLTKLNRLEQAGPFLRKSLAFARNLGDYTWECWLAGRVADLYHRRHQIESAISLATHYETRARDINESWSMADLAELLARFYIDLGDSGAALKWAQRALDVADANGFWHYQIRGAWRCAKAYSLLGDKTSAITLVSVSIEHLKARDEEIEERKSVIEFAQSI